MAAVGQGRERLIALLLGLAVVVIWGVSFTATRVAVRDVPPMTLAFLRFALAALVLWPLVRRRWGRWRLRAEDRWAGFFLGLTGVTLAFVCENTALKLTTASHAALIVATTPLATAAVEALVRRRLPRLSTTVGLVVALTGVFLIVGTARGSEGSVEGDLLMLATVSVWIAYSFLTKKLTAHYPTLVVTQVALVVGTVTLAPLALGELMVVGWFRPTTTALGALVYLGVFCSALAYLWWNRAIGVLGVTATNSLIYGIPLVGVATGVVALGEPLTITVVVGGILIIAGVTAASWRPGRRLPTG